MLAFRTPGLKYLLTPIILLLLLAPQTAYAQQTIFNVPSADTPEKGRLFLQHESQFRPWGPNNFWLGTHYAAYGLAKNLELDATLFSLSSPPSDTVSLGVGFKKVFPFRDHSWIKEPKVTVGDVFLIPVSGKGPGNWGYGHLSGRLPRLKTRITAGISTGTDELFGRNTVHFIGGIEHPVTERFILLLEWFSGTHSNALLIPGFSYNLTKTVGVYAGFQIPNNTRSSRSGFVFALSKLF